MNTQPRAVVLLSGGLDSSTVVAIAKSQGFDVNALSFSYGQRHSAELVAAEKVVRAMGITRHEIAQIDLRIFGGSALTSDMTVPKGRSIDEMGGGIPITYVPARNTIFLSFALAFAEVVDAQDVFLGVNALDYSGYPDCRPEYITAFQDLAVLATRAGVEGRATKIHAPLIHMKKADIIQTGVALGIDYSITLSCYDPTRNGEACGECDACALRLKGFAEAGIQDPAPYVSRAPGVKG